MTRTVDAVHGVFGYGGAGIMFITESGYLSYVAASDEQCLKPVDRPGRGVPSR
jgi:hypothetical protein